MAARALASPRGWALAQIAMKIRQSYARRVLVPRQPSCAHWDKLTICVSLGPGDHAI